MPENRNDWKPGTVDGQRRHLDPELRAEVARDEPAAPVARVLAVAGPELVDQRAGPDPRPPARERDGSGLPIEQAQVRQPRAAVPAGALERERIRVAPLPAEAGEDRVVRRQLVIDPAVGAVARAVRAAGSGGRRRSRPRRCSTGWAADRRNRGCSVPPGRSAPPGCGCPETARRSAGRARTNGFAEKSPPRIAAVGTMACEPPPSSLRWLPS